MRAASRWSPLLLAALALVACRSHRPPRSLPLADPPRAVTMRGADELERAVDGARVVCVGEFHDQLSHHRFQRDVLQRVAASGAPTLLGMEMFQRPAQQHLDDYVAGRIDEREMLRRTEWFTRWGADHTVYAPLWRFCRAHGVRVVALNADRDITRKVNRQGLDALTPAERSAIASEIDLDVAEHRRRVMGVFTGGVHPMPEDALERMYQAMTVWDETMAESAARALVDAGPSSRMVIVAGAGHVQEWSGIPARLARRVRGLTPLVVICRAPGTEMDDDGLPWDLADFVVRMPDDAATDTPKLGVKFREGTLTVDEIVPGGNAARIGLGAGDTILKVSKGDGMLIDVRDLVDLRWVLGELWVAGGKGGLLVGRRADGTPIRKSFDLVAPAPASQP